MSSRERAAIGLVAGAMLVAAFALGSAPRWAVCTTALLCLATMAPMISSRRALIDRPYILVFLAIAVGMTALQVLPLPGGLVKSISPYRWRLVVDNAAAWGVDPPGWTPLSYDPPATLVELAKLSGYLAFAFTCTWIASHTRGRQLLLTAAAAVASAMAFTAVIHFVVGTNKLFGLYQPDFNAPRLMAPLLNPNHLAGLLAFASPICVALAVAIPGQRRLMWIGAALLCAGVCLLTESRGGAIALVIGTLTTVILLWIQSRRSEATTATKIPRAVAVPAVIIMICGLALLAAFTAGGVMKEIRSTSTEQLSDAGYKLEAWRSSQTLIARHPWTGVGRGGFEPAFTRVHPSGLKVYSQVENEYLQAILDWGIPAAAAMAVVLVLMVISGGRRGLLGPFEAGALGGLVALGAQNAVDFNLQFPAVALPAIAAIAVLLPGKLRESRTYRRRIPLRIGAVAAGVMIVAAAALPWGATAKREADALDELMTTDVSNHAAEAQALTERHPSDYISFGLAARVMAAHGDARAARLINRAQSLNPDHSGLHHLAAQMLIAASRALEERAASAPADRAAKLREQAIQARAQSLVEYALALRTAIQPRGILADLIANVPDTETAAKGLPSDPDLVPEIVKQLSILGRADLALALLRRIHTEIPDNGDVAGLVSEYALAGGDAKLALEAGKQAFAFQPLGVNSLRYGKALSANGRNDEALAVLTEAVNQTRSRGTRIDTVALMIGLADVQRLLGKLIEAQATLTSAADMIGGDTAGAAAIHRGLAQVYDAQGFPNQAAVERRRAERGDPTILFPPDASGASASPPDATVPRDGGVPRDAGAAPRDAGAAPRDAGATRDARP